MIRSVVVDSREPPEVRGLSFYGVTKIIHELEYGDLWVTCDDGQTLVIERKEPEDFMGSMLSGRMIKQAHGLSGLKDAGLWPYVMIMGELMPGPNGMTYVNGKLNRTAYAAVQGCLLSIQELGVYVVHALNSMDLEAAVMRLANRDRSNEMRIPGRRKGRKTNVEVDLLAGLPGIGTEMAEQIMSFCGSGARALEMLTDGEYIPGVGKKKREEIRRVLGLEDGLALHVEQN